MTFFFPALPLRLSTPQSMIASALMSPPKVEYELSEIGHKFEPILAELKKWGDEYIEYLNENR